MKKIRFKNLNRRLQIGGRKKSINPFRTKRECSQWLQRQAGKKTIAQNRCKVVLKTAPPLFLPLTPPPPPYPWPGFRTPFHLGQSLGECFCDPISNGERVCDSERERERARARGFAHIQISLICMLPKIAFACVVDE